MNRIHQVILGALCSCAFLVPATHAGRPPAAHSSKPNIIFIYADDMGYGDCRAYNPGISIPTPNIDKLAKEGLLFTDAHSPHATCTGSRYGLLTGISPARTGVRNTITATGPAIDADEVTIARFLRDHGYATKMVGKWHLGFDPRGRGVKPGKSVDPSAPLTGGPLDRGFGYFLGNVAGLSEHPVRGRHQASSPADIKTQNREFCRDVVRIIREHAAADGGKPLFLYYALHEPHTPQIPEAGFVDRSGAGAYGDYIVQLDHWVGEVAGALRETGLEKDTLLVFASDNGASKRNMSTCPGHTANGVLSGYKATPLEGGHRVPLIMRWPGFIPVGATSSALVNHTDFFATFAELLGVDMSAKYPGAAADSHSFLAVLRDPSARHKRPAMVVVGSYREAGWKIIASDPGEKPGSTGITALYNLRDDLSEKKNLLETNPGTASRLFAGYKQFLDSRKLKPRATRKAPTKKRTGGSSDKKRGSS